MSAAANVREFLAKKYHHKVGVLHISTDRFHLS